MDINESVMLLGTDGCHLCEQAMALFEGTKWAPISADIIELGLVEAYGDKIPVLQVVNAQQALFWPFEQQQISEYLAFYGINSPF